MKTRATRMLFGVLTLVLGAIVVTAALDSGNARTAVAESAPAHDIAARPSVQFTDDGQLLQPIGYRKWVYVGTPITPNDMNHGKAAFPEFHSVYINPHSYEQYEKTGKFPNGTVLIKELCSVGSKQATSGSGYFMGDFTGLEVLMKDTERFKHEPGNWGFFSFGHEYPLKTAAKIQPTASCSDCHGGAADDDYVFTQYYPVLRAAKDKQ